MARNTGGRTSKTTPLGAVAKFSAGGKPIAGEGPGDDGDVVMATHTSPRWAYGEGRAGVARAFLEAEATTARR